MFTTATKSENGQKYLGVCRVPPPFGQKVRRVDFFSCPIDQYQCARLTCESSSPEPLANRFAAAVRFASARAWSLLRATAVAFAAQRCGSNRSARSQTRAATYTTARCGTGPASVATSSAKRRCAPRSARIGRGHLAARRSGWTTRSVSHAPCCSVAHAPLPPAHAASLLRGWGGAAHRGGGGCVRGARAALPRAEGAHRAGRARVAARLEARLHRRRIRSAPAADGGPRQTLPRGPRRRPPAAGSGRVVVGPRVRSERRGGAAECAGGARPRGGRRADQGGGGGGRGGV